MIDKCRVLSGLLKFCIYETLCYRNKLPKFSRIELRRFIWFYYLFFLEGDGLNLKRYLLSFEFEEGICYLS